MMFGILDYGLGNIQSVSNMLDYLDIDHIMVSKKSDFNLINKLILPGIGSYDNAIKKLHEKKMFLPIHDFIKNQNNFLIGICLGMQLLGKSSEEGILEGLSLIDFKVESLKKYISFSVPHMGWNRISNTLLNIPFNEIFKFYFVHSYFVPVSSSDSDYQSIMISNYGIPFSAAIRKKNIYGFQFHPEKSHKFGMELFKFLERL